MEIKCIRCGKQFTDTYEGVNEENRRCFCNKCVDELWENRRKEVKK